jgi:hypothetical protein
MRVARTSSLFFFNGGRNSMGINRTCSAFCFSSVQNGGRNIYARSFKIWRELLYTY